MAKGRKTGGRAKGSRNKSKTDVAVVARALVDDAVYREMFKVRLHGGTLPPGVEQMLWHYAYGKPAEHLHLGGEGGGPVLIRFVDAGA